MILEPGHSTEYLEKYKKGEITKGLGLGCSLDDYLRFKRSQVNIVLGHDNVGKSFFLFWYFLALHSQHGLRFLIWAGENRSGQIMRDLIQFYTGTRLSNLTMHEVNIYRAYLENAFGFVDNTQLYKPDQLLKIFAEQGQSYDGFLIDPFTGLDREFTHGANYDFMNKTREFVNKYNKTLYICTHPVTQSGRSIGIYPEGHHWFGHVKPPLKDHVEGGKPFTNRVDDMIVIHRLVKHEEMKYKTMVNVEKVKDQETGGKQTQLDFPLLFDFNSGLGFTIDGVDPMKRKVLTDQTVIQ